MYCICRQASDSSGNLPHEVVLIVQVWEDDSVYGGKCLRSSAKSYLIKRILIYNYMILCVITSSINTAFSSEVGFDADSGDVITAGEFFQNHEQYKLTGAFSKHWKSPVKAGCIPPLGGGSVGNGNGGCSSVQVAVPIIKHQFHNVSWDWRS